VISTIAFNPTRQILEYTIMEEPNLFSDGYTEDCFETAIPQYQGSFGKIPEGKITILEGPESPMPNEKCRSTFRLEDSQAGRRFRWSDEVIAGRTSKQFFSQAEQMRLDELMEKNNNGIISPDEKHELEKIGTRAEQLSLENARRLSKLRRTTD